jgi:outer membrane protein insertion porin family
VLLFPLLLAVAASPAPLVRAVHVEALDPARYAPYVAVVPGEPLDAAAVRRTVDRFYATGEFEDVVVETEPAGEEGVDVVIRPQPAALFARVVVKGDRVKNAKDVRKAARLRRGEPLWPARLDRAGQDVALALTADGYLEAVVEATAVRGPEGADAVFTVRAGPRARVRKATIVADDGPPAVPLEAEMRPGPGDVYRPARAAKSAEAMRRRLVAAGRWRARVEVAAPYDPRAASVDLAFRVASGPFSEVEVRGGETPHGVRTALEAIVREGAMRPDALEEASDRLEESFRRRGYREVASRHFYEKRAYGEALVFEVTPGPAFVAGSVRVVGGDDQPVVLQTQAGLPVEDRLVEEDLRTLRRRLEDRGHVEPLVEAEIPEGGGTVSVVFRVRPGPRTVVSEVTLDAPPLPDPSEPRRELRLRAGQPYRIRDLAADRATLVAAWRDSGYFDASVTPEVVFDEDRTGARIRLHVDPGPRTDVGEIVVAGLRDTNDLVVRRELLLKKGQPLGQRELLESQRRLAALGIFDRTDLVPLDPESPSPRDLVVSAHEAPAITLAYGLGYGERDKVRASFEVSRRNLFGMDRSLTAFVRGSFKGSRFLLNYREPWLLGHRTNLFVTGFWEEEDRVSFDYNRAGGVVQVARPLEKQHLNLIGRWGHTATHVFDIKVPIGEIDRQFRTYTLSGPSASLVYETRDDPLEPRRGSFMGTDLSLSLPVLGAARFVKGYFQAATYDQLNARTVFALAARLGLARTYGVGEPLALPLPERFFLGGAYGLRGYDEDAVGPRAPSEDGTLVPTGGNALVYAGAELRLDASRAFSVAAFAEMGGIYLFIRDIDLGQLRYTAGLGLRYKTAFGPLRVDWGYKLNRPFGESSNRFHFTIGHAF